MRGEGGRKGGGWDARTPLTRSLTLPMVLGQPTAARTDGRTDGARDDREMRLLYARGDGWMEGGERELEREGAKEGREEG